MAEVRGPHIDIRGFDKFQKQMKRIPVDTKRREMLIVLRPAATPTVTTLRSLVARHDVTGNLSRSVGKITGKNKTFPNILVGFRVRGSFRGNHGHLFDQGTAERHRSARRGGRKNISTGSAPAQNVVEKSYQMTQAQAIAKLEASMGRFVERKLAKHIK